MLSTSPPTMTSHWRTLDSEGEALGPDGAGLLEGTRQDAVRVCLTSLHKLFIVMTKKLSDSK